jgi:hypothetical protein
VVVVQSEDSKEGLIVWSLSRLFLARLRIPSVSTVVIGRRFDGPILEMFEHNVANDKSSIKY